MIGIGRALHQARLKQGFSIDDMHQKTNIHLEYLIALESEDFKVLPSPFYARGFLRAYARSLRLDPTHLLELYETQVMKRAPKHQDTSNSHTRQLGREKTVLPQAKAKQSSKSRPKRSEVYELRLSRRVTMAQRERETVRKRQIILWIGLLVLIVVAIVGFYYRADIKSFI